MKLTIVADDQAVGIDGEFIFPLEMPQLDASIHAVQWYGEYGEVEFKTVFINGSLIKPHNQPITDITPFQFAVDAWKMKKIEIVATEEAALLASTQDTVKKD